MGYAFRGSCFAVVEDARQAQCVDAYPLSSSDGSVLSCQTANTVGLTLVRSDGAGLGTPYSVTTAYAECSTTAVGSAVITPELAHQAWLFGFTGILICYLFASASGAIVNFIDRPRA